MNAMYCINCKYYAPDNKLCTHPKAVKERYPHMDWVYYKAAHRMRKFSNLCGKDGKWYIDKDDVLQEKEVTMRFPSCHDCKYVIPNESWYSTENQLYYAHCSHPNAIISTDIVTGEVEYKMTHQMREDKKNDIKSCGTLGLLYEERDHTVQQINENAHMMTYIQYLQILLFVCVCIIFWILIFSKQYVLAYFTAMVTYFTVFHWNK